MWQCNVCVSWEIKKIIIICHVTRGRLHSCAPDSVHPAHSIVTPLSETRRSVVYGWQKSRRRCAYHQLHLEREIIAVGLYVTHFLGHWVKARAWWTYRLHQHSILTSVSNTDSTSHTTQTNLSRMLILWHNLYKLRYRWQYGDVLQK